MSADLFGYAPTKPPFTDIANQRDSVAEEKAILCKQLGELVNKAPPADLQCRRKDRARVACAVRPCAENSRKQAIKPQ